MARITTLLTSEPVDVAVRFERAGGIWWHLWADDAGAADDDFHSRLAWLPHTTTQELPQLHRAAVQGAIILAGATARDREDFSAWAATRDDLDWLEWTRTLDPPWPWSAHVSAWAARCGRLRTLQWLRAQAPPCPWNELTCSGAAGEGQLEVLQWLRAQDPPCPWNWLTIECARRNGHAAVAEWARAHGCPGRPVANGSDPECLEGSAASRPHDSELRRKKD